MRRADRLFRLLQRLRRGRVLTAARLARELEVSLRTVYRDIADLAAAGVPIEGEAGVGYRLQGFDLPPLMFDREEIEAMVLGARVVEAWGDERLAAAAAEALGKIEAVLPRGRSHLLAETPLYVPVAGVRPGRRLPLSTFRVAVRERRRTVLLYRDLGGAETERPVRPLALTFFPPVWLLVAWCELRRDFRNFRLDRVLAAEVTAEVFPVEAGKTLADFLACMEAEDVGGGAEPAGGVRVTAGA